MQTHLHFIHNIQSHAARDYHSESVLVRVYFLPNLQAQPTENSCIQCS